MEKENTENSKNEKMQQPTDELLHKEMLDNASSEKQNADQEAARLKKIKEKAIEKEELGYTRSDALTNAEMILSFASESGIDVDPEMIGYIVKAKQMEKEGHWAVEDETYFWIAYKTIAQLIKPVSIDSIKASEESKIKKHTWVEKFFKKTRRKSLVHRSVLRYSSLALFFMVILLLLQIYALLGSQLLISIEEGNRVMTQGEDRLSELILITENNNDNRSAILEKNTIEIELVQKTKEVNSSIELLLAWMRIASFVYTDETKKMEKNIEPVSFDADADINFDAMTPEFVIDKNIMAIQEAKSMIQILSLYILPLLYGLLGGFVFVLRSISKETRNVTYTKASNLKYGLRIHLGALSGLAIGLFWGDIEKQNLGFIESLSTALVAFIAGYSIEFVFRLVDQMIFSIGEKNENKVPEASKPQKQAVKTEG